MGEAIVLTLLFGGLILGGIIIVGLSAYMELIILFSEGVQFVPLMGCLLSLAGIILVMTIVKIKKPEQNIIIEIICLTVGFGLFEGSFFNSVVHYGKEFLFYAAVLSQPLKCFIGWLISVTVEYNIKNKVDKLRLNIQNCYESQLECLQKCKELISTTVQDQRESEELIRLFEIIGNTELYKNYKNKSNIENGRIIKELKLILDASMLNLIHDDMLPQEIDKELDKHLKVTEDMCKLYQTSQYTVQDYKRLKGVYKSLPQKLSVAEGK